MSKFAFVTLVTSDSYLPGALTCISSVQDQEKGDFETVCLVTVEDLAQATILALQKAFTRVISVGKIETKNYEELNLLGRRDLAFAMTKLHVFRLTQYTKIIFLDADTLVLRPISQLFQLPQPFSAAPDAGWPDSFNSGVMVIEPSQEVFDGLMDMMAQKGSWDGADQGLLNEFFPNWNRLSFLYNSTPSAHYTYAPAYRKNGDDVFVVHFIGKDKPWSKEPSSTQNPTSDYSQLVQKWVNCFELHFGTANFDSTKILLPPSSFKVAPTPIAPSAPDSKPTTWDPARSSPPRDSAFQWKNEPAHYGNIWDASITEQRTRFVPPTSYPSIPSSTHEWYKESMQFKPDPRKVRAIFPFEQGAPTATRSFPADDGSQFRPLPSMIPSPPITSAYAQVQSPSDGFTNAWDSIPGINRYAEALARSSGSRKPIPAIAINSDLTNRTSSLESGPHPDLTNRVSSLAVPVMEMDGLEEGSRDGDDEDSADEVEDRIPLPLRSRSSSRASSRERIGEGLGLVTGGGSRGNVPLSPRKLRQTSLESNYQNSQTAPPPPRRNAPTPSPRLVATAIKNSYSIQPRNIDAGNGSTAPAVRASRVFAAETDVDVFKSKGLDALRKFVGKN